MIDCVSCTNYFKLMLSCFLFLTIQMLMTEQKLNKWRFMGLFLTYRSVLTVIIVWKKWRIHTLFTCGCFTLYFHLRYRNMFIGEGGAEPFLISLCYFFQFMTFTCDNLNRNCPPPQSYPVGSLLSPSYPSTSYLFSKALTEHNISNTFLLLICALSEFHRPHAL